MQAGIKRYHAELMLILATMIWGGTFSALKMGLEHTSPFYLVALRFLIASILFGLYFPMKKELPTWDGFRKGLVLGAVMFLAFSLQTIGLQTTSPSRSAFITQLLILFTPPIQWIVLRRRPGRGSIVALILIVSGMYLLLAPDLSGWQWGDFYTLLCAILFALYIVLLDPFTESSHLPTLLFVQTAIAALLSFLVASFISESPVHTDWHLALLLVYLGPLGTFLALFLQNRYQHFTTPVRASIIFTLEPVFATIYASIIWQNFPAGREMLGGMIAIMGMIYSTVRQYRDTKNSSL